MIAARARARYSSIELIGRREGGLARTAARRVPLLIPVLALALALAASIISWRTGSMALYGDARAHMNVARRVTDALTPGLAQLGSVWLPLPQILMAPLVAIDWLWHSAVGGAIVSGLAFFYSSVRVYSLADEWFESRAAGWAAFLIYVTNLNLLYLQSTALTEPLLLAFFVGAGYHLLRWTKTLSPLSLIAAALLTFCATLTRFDGWVLFAVEAVVVLVWSLRHDSRKHSTQANTILFAAVGGYGIAMWFLYNLIIFGDPLAWVHSTFSSQSQQLALAQVGELQTKGNAKLSLLTYGWDVLDVAGVLITVMGALGLVALLFRRGAALQRNLVMMAVLAAPIAFNLLALYTGQSTIRVPQVSPAGMWNVRYGAMALPLLVVGAAALVQRRKLILPLVLGVAAVSLALSLRATPITLADGQSGISSAAANGTPDVAAAYLGKHYSGGQVLADDASAAPFMFASGLPLRDFTTIGMHPYWEHAIVDPRKNVRWLVVYPGDAVYSDMKSHPDRFTGYRQVFHSGPVTLYERTSG